MPMALMPLGLNRAVLIANIPFCASESAQGWSSISEADNSNCLEALASSLAEEANWLDADDWLDLFSNCQNGTINAGHKSMEYPAGDCTASKSADPAGANCKSGHLVHCI